MPDTWIKFRDDLDTDPRVSRMAAYLAGTAQMYILATPAADLFGSVTKAVTRHALRDVTLAGLTRVWSHACRHTTDGIFHGVDLTYLDDLSRIPGFGAAMQLVGWAEYNDTTSTLTLPNFTEHNAPDKNGARSQTAAARRAQRYRDKQRTQLPDPPITDPVNEVTPVNPVPAERDGVTSRVTPPVTPESVTPPMTRDVTPSISISSSISQSKNSESGKGESRGETAAKPIPPPPDPNDTLAVLNYAKLRINRLRGSWHKLAHWSSEEEHALSDALPNLRAMEDQDWCILAYWLRWAHSGANQQKADPVRVTSRRHAFVTDLPANYDRAVTHWKQTGSPRLNPDGTTARAKVLPFKQPEPEAPPTPNENAFLGLLAANGGAVPQHLQQPATVATNPSS
jgi:hypothetical protein